MNFGEIKAKVKEALYGEGASVDYVTSLIPKWINTGQKNIETNGNYGWMIERASGTMLDTNYFQNIPTNNYKETIYFKIQDENVWYSVEKRNEDDCFSSYPDLVNDKGRPVVFAYYSSQKEILFRPTPDKLYKVEWYYFRYSFDLFNDTDIPFQIPEHLITDNLSMALVYAGLIESQAFLGDNPEVEKWKVMLENILTPLRITEKIEILAGSPLKMRLPSGRKII